MDISAGHPPSFGLPQQPHNADEEGAMVNGGDMYAPHYTSDQVKPNRKVRKKVCDFFASYIGLHFVYIHVK